MAPSAKSDASVSTTACLAGSKCFKTGAVQKDCFSVSCACLMDSVLFHSWAGCAVELDRGSAILE